MKNSTIGRLVFILILLNPALVMANGTLNLNLYSFHPGTVLGRIIGTSNRENPGQYMLKPAANFRQTEKALFGRQNSAPKQHTQTYNTVQTYHL